ncbi:MAG TPA: hypothetical protein VFW50_25365 [Streptosporangiaceae bacterium]|nr:hypothetical protein [Streptosporangiaceae bacterium]
MTSMLWRARRAISSQTSCACSARPGLADRAADLAQLVPDLTALPARYRSSQLSGDTSPTIPPRPPVTRGPLKPRRS